MGGAREAGGGVMSISVAAHDPSGPSGHLPTLRVGRNVRGARRNCRQRVSRCPTLRAHAVEGGTMAAVPVTAEIARRAAVLAWNDLPDDLVERTKQCLLDWF